ncbi:hypothetical protein BGZ94_000020 [Podila epigama]|nr:hypothetical protein BGZ94_000020 [Podila epigama]
MTRSENSLFSPSSKARSIFNKKRWTLLLILAGLTIGWLGCEYGHHLQDPLVIGVEHPGQAKRHHRFWKRGFKFPESKYIVPSTLLANPDSLPRIFDLFIFNNEFDMLEIHLNELHHVIDKFVIVEFNLTISGAPKRLYFEENKHLFKRFEDKILHIILPPITSKDTYTYTTNWMYEFYMRDKGFEMAKEALSPRDGDWIILADVDEILRPAVLHAMKTPDGKSDLDLIFADRPVEAGGAWDLFRFDCRFFRYSYEYYYGDHAGPVAMRFRDPASHLARVQLKGHEGYLYKKQKEYLAMLGARNWTRAGTDIRWSKMTIAATVIDDACWHCTWCFSRYSQMLVKIDGYAHREYNRPEFKTKEWILEHCRTGRDIINKNDGEIVYFEDNSDIPDYLRRNRKQFSNVLAIRQSLKSAVPRTEILTTLTSVTSNATLLSYPTGSYTGMRTFDMLSIMDFTGHTTRLANSLQRISFAAEEGAAEDAEVAAGLASLRTPEAMKQEATHLVRAGLKAYYKQFTEQGQDLATAGEAKVTVLCTWDLKNKAPTLLAHFEQLKTPKTPRCKVEVHGSPRHNAMAKDSQWVRDREKLENEISKDSNEALLFDESTKHIYEGLSSNFFALDRETRTVLTAPLDSVLQGTILKVVLSVCEEYKIPVKFSFPNLDNIEDYEGAFISSTSRLVLPIKTMVLPDGSLKHFSESPTIELIRESVRKECQKRTERILSVQEISEE